MSTPGHQSQSNEGANKGRGRLSSDKSAASKRNRASLPYYRSLFKERDDIILEGELPPSRLPDVAVASFGDYTVLEAVIGKDDRVRVEDALMRTNPWRQICALRIRSSTGKNYVGTAWFIGPRTLATAGHCVYLHKEGGWAQSIDVIPALYGSDEPFGRATSTRFRCVDGWTSSPNRDFDYGVILLDDDNLGDSLGNWEVGALPDSDLVGTRASISGYPADLGDAQYQYFHERPLSSTTPTRLEYDIDTFGGQSGSPIWCNSEETGLIAIGIHTTGGLSSNSGTRINSEVLENLVRWQEE